MEEIREVLTISAVKYSILKNTTQENMVFDIEKSVALEGNSGPYLQYTHARANSILNKVKARPNISSKSEFKEKEEINLLKLIYRFPEIVGKATQNNSPNLICNYLFKLAQEFNCFYDKISIVKTEQNDMKKARLALTKGVAQVINNGLDLLGIPVLEKM
jgi:arginyl-tRNA synthetase